MSKRDSNLLISNKEDLESKAMLTILKQGTKSKENGDYRSATEVFSDLRSSL